MRSPVAGNVIETRPTHAAEVLVEVCTERVKQEGAARPIEYEGGCACIRRRSEPQTASSAHSPQ